jgi:hypothetical protein
VPFVCSLRDDIFVIEAVGTIRHEDVPELERAERMFFDEHPDHPARFLCDCTRMKVISPEARDVLLELMRRDTALLERAAFVIGSGVNALQLRRMILDAGSPKRRTFTDEFEAMKWLRSSGSLE